MSLLKQANFMKLIQSLENIVVRMCLLNYLHAHFAVFLSYRFNLQLPCS
jgi:hypothetical protein